MPEAYLQKEQETLNLVFPQKINLKLITKKFRKLTNVNKLAKMQPIGI